MQLALHNAYPYIMHVQSDFFNEFVLVSIPKLPMLEDEWISVHSPRLAEQQTYIPSWQWVSIFMHIF